LAQTLQHAAAIQRLGIPATGSRKHRANGPAADYALTIKLDQSDQAAHLPIHLELKRVLDSLPNDNLTFLVADRGGPLKPESFTNWFKRMVQDAGLSGLSAHGLRKANCRLLAEGGCTPHQIMAISGHKTLSEVTRYTVAANRTQLSDDAMASMGTIKKRT